MNAAPTGVGNRLLYQLSYTPSMILIIACSPIRESRGLKGGASCLAVAAFAGSGSHDSAPGASSSRRAGRLPQSGWLVTASARASCAGH